MTPQFLYTLATEYLGFKDFGLLHKFLCQRICEPRQAQVRLILIPRGFFKTSLFTYTDNTGLAIDDPNIRILQCSGVLPNSKIMVQKWGRTFTHNQLFRDRFKDWCPKNPENPETTWNSSAIYLPNRTTHHAEGTMEAMGADSTIVSRHYDYMKFDDIVTPENCTTKDQMDKIIRFVLECFGLCDNRKYTPVDIIGTTWDDGDLYAYYIKKWQDAVRAGVKSDVEVIKIPATYQPPKTEKERHSDKRTIGIRLPITPGESVFPERYTSQDLEEFKREDPETYAKFYELDPVPLGDRTFTDFFYYEEIPSNVRIFMTVDPAPTTDPTSHPSAINITAVDENKTAYCMLSWKKKVNPNILIDKLWEFYFAYGCEKLGIESYVYQRALKFWLYERIVNDPENRHMSIVELKHKQQSKNDHIATLAPYVNTGKYKFLKSQQSLVYSLSRFPKSKDRDEADAAAYQIQIIKPSNKKQQKLVKPKSLEAMKKKFLPHLNKSRPVLYVGS